MPEITDFQRLLSITPRKRLGLPCLLGTFQMGFSKLGDEDICLIRSQLGDFRVGLDKLGDLILLSGIYRTDNVTGQTKYYREPYYVPKNPRSDDQQAQRTKYVAGIAAWQALTNEQKEVYNQRAKNQNFSGYNLFLKEYLLSN